MRETPGGLKGLCIDHRIKGRMESLLAAAHKLVYSMFQWVKRGFAQ